MSADDKDVRPSDDLNKGESSGQPQNILRSSKSSTDRRVSFPDQEREVTQYFEPANPWQDVPPTTRAQLAAEYLESCRRHNTPPIDSVLQQIRELPEGTIGGAMRAPRLLLCECSLLGTKPVDALEAVLRKTQFRRLEIEHAALDDEGAEALFDMIEYYESANAVSISGPRQFGIRGWQAASRMIKKSCQLCELEVSSAPLEAAHAPVLSRALHALHCPLRALTLQRANLAGEPLLCLVIALKSNTSLRELRLGDNHLTAADASQLAALLRYNSRLQLLDLSNNQIQDAGAAQLAEALAEQAALSPPGAEPLDSLHSPLSGYETRGLAFLVLWNNQLTRNCAPHLAKALVSQSLCVLNVGRNALGADTVRALSGAASGAALLSLGLQAARLGPAAGRAIADLVRARSRLQRLDLRDNKLGAQGLQAILAAMKENTTLTQIDLDDVTECPSHLSAETALAAEEAAERALVARLTAEVRALCRGNEPSAASPDRRAHRKISLTCHSAAAKAVYAEESPRTRLRSPLPSPAGSPVPTTPSRFSVTRVTPDREPRDSGSPSTPTSRFKVVQVAEPPQIFVQTPEQPRRSASRFSVTRNYDSVYNPTPAPSPTPDSGPASPAPTPEPVPPQPAPKVDQNKSYSDKVSDISDKTADCKSNSDTQTTEVDNKSDKNNKCDKSETKIDSGSNYHDKTEQLSHSEIVDNETLKTETRLVKNTTDVSETEKVDVQVEVTVKTENIKPAKVHCDQNVSEFRDIDNINVKEKRDDVAMKQIEAITEDLGNLIREMKDLSTKTAVLTKKDVKTKSDCTQTDVADLDITIDTYNVPVNFIRDSVVLKKNKSESSLDSPDLEVSRLMNKKLSEASPFCDSTSSLEISGSSMESLSAIDHQHLPQIAKPIIVQAVESDTELDRRKPDHALSTESSIESNTSDATPVNSGNYLNMSVSSNESVSPIIFGKGKKIHGSLSSLEASVSSIDSARQEKVMVTSADSGIEYSLQNPSESKEDTSSNEGTLTNNSSLKESVKKPERFQLQDTLTSSPKRTSSLLDVPALKNKSLERMRKISLGPSSSFHVARPDPEKTEAKQPTNLEKLLSLFHHPASIFSRSSQNDEEKKSAPSIPARKDSSLSSAFWSWGSATEKAEERDSSEATDSTLSERIQVSFVDESFSKKLDKTPSTDTENTLSEFQSFPTPNLDGESADELTYTTDEIVQKNLVVSVSVDNPSSNGNKACDILDLINPNDLNKNFDAGQATVDKETSSDTKLEELNPARPRSFAAVLKASGSENSLDKQLTPDNGQSVEKLPSKVIRGIKENISPENTLTSSMTKTLALELNERQIRNQPVVNTVWEMTAPLLDAEPKAPIATIEETNDEAADNAVQLSYLGIRFIDEKNNSADNETTLETFDEKKYDIKVIEPNLESVDLGKDALSYLIYENQDFEPEVEQAVSNTAQEGSLAEELKQAEIKEKLLDLSPELIIDEAVDPEVSVKDKVRSSVVPERAKLKKSNSLENLNLTLQEKSPKTKTIAFKIPESTTTPRDIPEARSRLRSRCGSSPKSLPESLNKPSPLIKMECMKKKKKVSSLGKMARDSLLALNMTEEEIAEFRSRPMTSVESLKSLESVSEDANSQSGTSIDSRCRACLRTSQESLMSLDSITEDCKCDVEKEKPRSVR